MENSGKIREFDSGNPVGTLKEYRLICHFIQISRLMGESESIEAMFIFRNT